MASDMRQTQSAIGREEANTCVLKSMIKSSIRDDKRLNGLEEPKQVKQMTERGLAEADPEYFGDRLYVKTVDYITVWPELQQMP